MIKEVKLVIWGRKLTLPVIFDYYTGENITKEQKNALKQFIIHPEWVANSKTYVEDFCKEALMDDEENEKKDNIFSYVKPESIFVKRKGLSPNIVLLCKYRYDIEHGLAVAYDSEGVIKVGIQDSIM